jgi:hypothetical protein
VLDLDKKKHTKIQLQKPLCIAAWVILIWKSTEGMYTIDNKKRYQSGNQNTQVLEEQTTQWQKGRKTNTDLTSEVKSN